MGCSCLSRLEHAPSCADCRRALPRFFPTARRCYRSRRKTTQRGAMTGLLTLALKYEQDVVTVRQRARQVAARLGFDSQDQVRIATAVSEIARNAFSYAGGGKVEFHVDVQASPQAMIIRIVDEGPGIPDLDAVLTGRYQSRTGMGLGIVGARRLMDECDIRSQLGNGTEIRLAKSLPETAPPVTAASLARVIDELIAKQPQTAYE